MKTIKLAAARTGQNPVPAEANPCSVHFNMNAAKAYAISNIDRTLNAFRAAGEAGADFAFSIEDIASVDDKRLEKKDIFMEIAETTPGYTMEKMSEISRKYKMYTAANFYEKVKGKEKAFNTTVLIGRNGSLIGKYHKVHMPSSERWLCEPGTDTPVFETDIGNIGFAVCYDIVFPEHCRALALQGADIILHPTVGWGFNYGSLGEQLVRVRAAENAVYLAVAKSIHYGNPGGRSCVIDHSGNLLSQNFDETDGFALAEFIPNYDMVNERNFFSFFSGVDRVRARIALERMPETYDILCQKTPPLISSRYLNIKYARELPDISKISKQWDEYKQDCHEGREPKLDYEW